MHIFLGSLKAFFSHLNILISNDLLFSARGQTTFGIALSMTAERAQLGKIPVNSILCAVLLDLCRYVTSGEPKHRCQVITSAYVPANCRKNCSKVCV